MHDTYLLQNILKSIKDVCKENQIVKIEKIKLLVNHNSHVNEESLLEHLKLNINDLLEEPVELIILRENIEEQTAIIQKIQGEKGE